MCMNTSGKAEFRATASVSEFKVKGILRMFSAAVCPIHFMHVEK